ncbi:von Willebrand factor (vWF) type A domain [Mactra antiquata]
MEVGKFLTKTLAVVLTVIIVVQSAPSKIQKVKKACGSKPAEIFFLLDSSSSIYILDFEIQLEFVNNVIDAFDIGPNATRIGVASYSNKYYPNFGLNTYDNKKDIKNAVSKISHKLGGTYTYEALDGVRKNGLNEENTRPGVTRILIVLTDGESYDEEETKKAALKVKEEGIVVFAVGIGNQIDRHELESIASEPKEKYLFEVGKFGLLDSVKEKLAIKACEVEDAPAGPACGQNNPADIMFLVDPVAVGEAHTQVIYEYISDLLPEFNFNKNHIKVGLESQNCGAGTLNLRHYPDYTEIEKSLRHIEISGLPRMLKKLRTHSYKPEHGGRDHARHMAVLFVDDKLFDPKSVLDQARRSKLYDVELFVVAIGDTVVDDELFTLCSSSVDRHLIRVPSYADLKASKPEFLEKLCHGL